eukprot:TRINITY_DN54733_c0_g1_i1.p1 TRINITY_DN54733_c0_g1~~TRINITY_DN54733_c0_g1_i1.p1  ORF type:complete len:261 (+),score=44.20 TRINITY_DN54733_c0_g1_i1:75-785(+)
MLIPVVGVFALASSFHLARALDLTTCGSCKACEDGSDTCSPLSIKRGASMELCSSESPQGEDMVLTADIEVASLQHTSGDCGTFSMDLYLQDDPSKKYKGVEEKECYDPKKFMFDATEVFVGTGDKQVCVRLSCDSDGDSDCQLMYQLKWARASESETRKAVKQAKNILFFILGVVFMAMTARACLYFYCLKDQYDRGEYQEASFVCLLCCFCDCFCVGKLCDLWGLCNSKTADSE